MMRFGFGKDGEVKMFVRWKFRIGTRQYWVVVYVVGQVLPTLPTSIPIFMILHLYRF
jgi:hypothetical protein